MLLEPPFIGTPFAVESHGAEVRGPKWNNKPYPSFIVTVPGTFLSIRNKSVPNKFVSYSAVTDEAYRH
jgi:hypothetical protein